MASSIDRYRQTVLILMATGICLGYAGGLFALKET